MGHASYRNNPESMLCQKPIQYVVTEEQERVERSAKRNNSVLL